MKILKLPFVAVLFITALLTSCEGNKKVRQHPSL
jgi:hypothetical protein